MEFLPGSIRRFTKALLAGTRQWLGPFPADVEEPAVRYRLLRRNLIILMLLVTLVPFGLMAAFNYLQYRKALTGEIFEPLRIMANKTRHSFELFLAERLSAVNFIASAYSFEELSDERVLKHIFRVMKHEFKGFVDLGLIDSNGLQLGYVGPYELKGKDYRQQGWFHDVQVRGSYISDVFLGYRKFPHIAIAVQHMDESGKWWVLRATIETTIFDDLIASMGLAPQSDALLVNREGIVQTNSKFFGKVLDKCPVCVFPASREADVVELVDQHGRQVLVAYSQLVNSDFVLVVVKPKADVLKAWYTLKSELFYLVLGSVIVIILVVLRLTGQLVQRIRESERRRELAFREMEHSHKLSSIGRLAAGVAHEINNPMAIINEKAGLMKDLIEHGREDFPRKDDFLNHIAAILRSVDRCRGITHPLLGFARRMDVQVELLDLNEVIGEVIKFLENESLHRGLELKVVTAENLPRIASDRGQLQQVFLNVLNNAFAAVEDGGRVSITTREEDEDRVAVAIQDNGVGMSREIMEHIFEPFFTTKKVYGTGLGLSITYGIVKKLGGDIKVESELNAGTTFTVFLPKKSVWEAGGLDGGP